ncbi:MAG: gluconate 2-dehydrogenase subunit 3 family protein, partial [Actinomycetota bacterium]|nr:gluconate 2-dehydrogenase subunit 3 family protein [Actinomycetota bacterium]
MSSESEWPSLNIAARQPGAPLFFSSEEWQVVEAATARIIPTDRDPGAKEACVTRFLDRFLSGTDYIYANARGDGFLQLQGKKAEAWRARIEHRQKVYREGI